MKGVITTIDLFVNGQIIVREFGLRAWTRCIWRVIWAKEPITFLDLVVRL